MQIVVNKMLTHYDKQGTGKSVLLLHGWGDNLATYKSLQTRLAKSYSVISLDLPGFGTTEPPQQAWDLDDYAVFVRAFLDKLGVGTLHAVIGHSNGAALAIRGVSIEQINPQKLVLISAAGIRDANHIRRAAVKSVAKVGKVLTIGLPKKHKDKMQKLLYGVIGSDMLVSPALKETFKKTVRQDVQSDAARIKIPTLIIYGKNDRATPVGDAKLYHKLIPASKLSLLEGGHFIHHEQDAMVNSLVEEFLK